MDKVDYQITDKFCEEALIALQVDNDIPFWLQENKSLFESISIQPSGLPSIADSNYDGVKYHFISQFHSLYKQLHY